MKTKIIFAVLFSALFSLNAFAKRYRVVEVVGTVTITVDGITTNLTYTGQTFTANVPLNELGLGTCSSAISFAERINGAQPQTATRTCSKSSRRVTCTGPTCRPNSLIAGNVIGNNRRELDAFLMQDDVQLSQTLIASIHSEGLQLTAVQMNNSVVKVNNGAHIQRTDVQLNTTKAPAAIQNMPRMNKAAQRQR